MRHFRLEYISLYLHRISVFTQNLGQTLGTLAHQLTCILQCLAYAAILLPLAFLKRSQYTIKSHTITY